MSKDKAKSILHVLFVTEVDLGPAVLRQEDGVAFLDVDCHEVALAVPHPRPHRHHLPGVQLRPQRSQDEKHSVYRGE